LCTQFECTFHFDHVASTQALSFYTARERVNIIY
jgi:hypothetical protein